MAVSGARVVLDDAGGGFGYGSALKPDLSNTQFAMQALHDAGVKSDDESFRKAIDCCE